VAETLGRKPDQGQVRIQLAQRQVDDQRPILSWCTAISFAAMT